ncbi:CBO0543 family protein [Ammoniphilus sp. YIM 78166]|uniref:CBO0543 family protein n=1 Tax=Ammoniphilus sp. YIM 78166 TaxID=1644106 RepID=UPI00106F617B|nr:CBO0543 family protein [Ammoniphilus sp. YIM 78166]
MKDKDILKLFLIIGMACLPTVVRKPPAKYFVTIFMINSVFNYFLDNYLVKKGYLKYPVKLIPGIKHSALYDHLICPLVSVWVCQATYASKLKGILFKSFLFAVPQAGFEVLAERKTNLIKFQNGWTGIHSFLTVILAKLSLRAFLEVLKRTTYQRGDRQST